MFGNLPAALDDVRQRLTREWITERPAGAAQIEGCVAIFAAFDDALRPLLGSLATRAIAGRAIRLTAGKFPALASVTVDERGLDATSLAAALGKVSATRGQDCVVVLVGQLFTVVHGLLADVTPQLLVYVEVGLAARKSAAPGERAAE